MPRCGSGGWGYSVYTLCRAFAPNTDTQPHCGTISQRMHEMVTVHQAWYTASTQNILVTIITLVISSYSLVAKLQHIVSPCVKCRD